MQPLNQIFNAIMRSIKFALGLSLATACSNAAIAETRQHSSHEHGSAVLNVATTDQVLSVEYLTPAANIVGFEYAPSTEEQKHAVHEAMELLESREMLSVPDDAACTLTRAEVEHEAEDGEHEEHSTEEHDEHEEHEEHEEHGDAEETHSEFHVEYEYQCQNIGALAHIDVKLFTYFPGNENITAQIITPNGQKGVELTPNSTRLTLP